MPTPPASSPSSRLTLPPTMRRPLGTTCDVCGQPVQIEQWAELALFAGGQPVPNGRGDHTPMELCAACVGSVIGFVHVLRGRLHQGTLP